MTAIHNMLVGSQEDVITLNVSTTPAAVTEYTTLVSDTSSACVASATGGSGSYSYAWTKLTNDHPNLVIDSPGFASTTFSVSSLPVSTAWSETVRCTATDTTNPSVTGFINVYVTFVRF